MDPRAYELARALDRRIGGTLDPAQWPVLAKERLAGCEPELAADLLQATLEGLLRGELRDAWPAVGTALVADALGYALIEPIYRAAADADHRALRMLLVSGSVAHRVADESELPRDDNLDGVTLGERKALARGNDPDLLDRLVFDPEPAVVRVLLANPRTTEATVLRLVARRPNRFGVLAELARAPRWLARRRIQQALVLNPYAPLRLALVHVPQRAPSELRQIAATGGLHPGLRALATELLALRDALLTAPVSTPDP